MAKTIPDGFTAITPYLVVPDVEAELKFIVEAFGAKEHYRLGPPGAPPMHAEADISGAIVMMGRAGNGYPPLPTLLYLYVADADATYAKAVAAGGTAERPLTDMFYGDRTGTVKSPGGISYSISKHLEDLTPKQIAERMAKQFGGPKP